LVKATPRNGWIDVALDALCVENTDERGWRFAPHGWVAMRASLDAKLDGLTQRIIGAGSPSPTVLNMAFSRLSIETRLSRRCKRRACNGIE